MKKLTILRSLTIASVFCVSTANATHVDFQINGIKESEGKLYIQIFQGENNYAKGEALMATAVAPQSDSTVVRFSDLDPGEYALRFFHDENNNGELETNLFGIPTEGYGFSNNAKPNFGPVSYEEIKFAVSADESVVTNTTQVIY